MSRMRPPLPPEPRRTWRTLFALIIAILALVGTLSISNITSVELRKLASPQGIAAAFDRLGDFLSPEILVPNVVTDTAVIPFPVPCGAASAPEPLLSQLRLFATPNCGSPGDVIEVLVTGAQPGATVQLRWLVPGGGRLSGPRATADAQGQVKTTIEVRPLMQSADGEIGSLEAEAIASAGGLRFSDVVGQTVDKILETLFMALMATTFGSILAIPISFLGAHNITGRGPIGTAVYYVMRLLLGLLRAIEPLVLALIFALLVGFGIFSGTLALTVVTTASMGKLFSEAIEDIDGGPIEAVLATGANRLQTIVYAVVPQIVPPYVSFAIYHWDINVRISTILGFVGAGGIGKLLIDLVNIGQFNRAGTPLIAIVLVVAVLDFFSARVRQRFI